MTEKAMSTLFEPFFASRPHGEGAGLSLSSRYGSLKETGGCMRLQSRPAQGSKVSIFPKTPADPDDALADAPPTRERTASDFTVLAVDDDPLLRDFVRNLICMMNYKVIIAANGEAALEVLANATKVDLLFTDIVMGDGMNGWELAHRALMLFPDLPVLFTSAYPNATRSPMGDLTRKFRILRKPYRARELSAAIREALDMAPPAGRSD